MDEERTLMGEIDKAYRHERDMVLMLRKENERIHSASGGWAKEVDRLDTELRQQRMLVEQLHTQAEVDTEALNRYKALCDDLATVLNDVLSQILASGTPILRDQGAEAVRVSARYREARGR